MTLKIVDGFGLFVDGVASILGLEFYTGVVTLWTTLVNRLVGAETFRDVLTVGFFLSAPSLE